MAERPLKCMGGGGKFRRQRVNRMVSFLSSNIVMLTFFHILKYLELELQQDV